MRGRYREPTVLKDDVGPGIWSRLARADNRMWQSLREAIHTYAHNTGDPTRASGKHFDVAVTTHGRSSPRACGRDAGVVLEGRGAGKRLCDSPARHNRLHLPQTGDATGQLLALFTRPAWTLKAS